ncbi:MAG: hypothetical protein PHU04_05655, partial [Candidatus Peribacteraceae bacterium]|nr:hypothetical protein [Candidatus Peribacteraceae bacterium]
MQFRRFLFLVVVVIAAFWLQRASARVAISEVMWAGSDLSTADEWVELIGMGFGLGFGSGAEVVADDLSGWVLTTRNSSGEEVPIIRFASGTTLAPEFFLLISNYDAQHSRLAVDPQVVSTAVSLPNTKLQLKLYDDSGALIDVAGDGIGAPVAGTNASGTGFWASMERISFGLSGDDPSAWQTARTSRGLDDGAPVLGTPGFPHGSDTDASSSQSSYFSQSPFSSLASFLPSESSSEENVSFCSSARSSSGCSEACSWGFAGSSDSSYSSQSSSLPNPNPNLIPVRITEVLANPIGRDDDEWIEVGNIGMSSMDIAGWILDEGNSPDHFAIPAVRTASGAAGFMLAPGEHIAFRKSVSGLPLDNGGEELSFWSGSVLIDRWSYPETAEHVSYGWDATGSGAFRVFCIPTENAPNAVLPFTIVIGIQSTNGTV